LLPPSQRPNFLLSALRASNFGPSIRSSPSPTISGSYTGYGHMSQVSSDVNAFRGMTANSCIDALFMTNLMLSLCVKSSSLNFLPCTLKIISIFRQNASASGGLRPQTPDRRTLPINPAGGLPSPRPLAPSKNLWPPLTPNSGSLEPPLVKITNHTR